MLRKVEFSGRGEGGFGATHNSVSSSSQLSEGNRFSSNPGKELSAEFEDRVHCFCKKGARRRTSWTWRNPGRRFYNCAGNSGQRCKFFVWIDPEQSVSEKEMIVKKLIGENEVLKKENAYLKQVMADQQCRLNAREMSMEQVLEQSVELEQRTSSNCSATNVQQGGISWLIQLLKVVVGIIICGCVIRFWKA